jgi:hypothetical protein
LVTASARLLRASWPTPGGMLPIAADAVRVGAGAGVGLLPGAVVGRLRLAGNGLLGGAGVRLLRLAAIGLLPDALVGLLWLALVGLLPDALVGLLWLALVGRLWLAGVGRLWLALVGRLGLALVGRLGLALVGWLWLALVGWLRPARGARLPIAAARCGWGTALRALPFLPAPTRRRCVGRASSARAGALLRVAAGGRTCCRSRGQRCRRNADGYKEDERKHPTRANCLVATHPTGPERAPIWAHDPRPTYPHGRDGKRFTKQATA